MRRGHGQRETRDANQLVKRILGQVAKYYYYYNAKYRDCTKLTNSLCNLPRNPRYSLVQILIYYFLTVLPTGVF
jgi:hypothetical protein